jgi:quinone-modifying oxidoreductase subunit QmoB
MDKKYGVYICTGCGIGDALDMVYIYAQAAESGMPLI